MMAVGSRFALPSQAFYRHKGQSSIVAAGILATIVAVTMGSKYWIGLSRITYLTTKTVSGDVMRHGKNPIIIIVQSSAGESQGHCCYC